MKTLLEQQRDKDPATLCDALVDTITEFNSGSVLTDDICVLAFRWNGSLN